MRISGLVTFATMAVSAFASPLLSGAASGAQETAASTVTETVTTCTEVITILEGSIEKVQDRTGSINETVARVESGDMDEGDATKDITTQLEGIEAALTEVVSSLTGAAGINVEADQLDRVLALVNILLRELLATVNYVVSTLSLGDALSSILKVVFGLVTKILVLLIGLLAGLLPGLLAILTPILESVGKGLLAPLLKPVISLLTGLGGVPNP